MTEARRIIPALLNRMSNAAEVADGAFDDAFTVRGAGDVTGLKDGSSAVIGNLGGNRLPAGLIDVRHDDRRAFLGKQQSASPAQCRMPRR